MFERVYTTPSGKRSGLYNDMLNQVHMLIAGATGSGKSTVVNGIMHAALYQSPAVVQFILIDPKGTELDMYARLPHTIQYAQTSQECLAALNSALDITRARFNAMKKKKLREYDGPHIYVVIDELMYLFNRPDVKRQAMNTLQDILVIARAARVHVIACTQNPTTATIPATLRCNFDSRLGLRTTTAQDSRNIIGVKGCELFPNPTLTHTAYGYYMHGGENEVFELPRIEDEEIQRLITYWKKNSKPRLKLFA